MSELTYKDSQFSSSEIAQVARLHQVGVNAGFLSSLGVSFLIKLYTTISSTDGGVLIVALKDDKVAGFVSGAVSIKPIYRRLLKTNFFSLPFILLPALLSFKNIKKIAELAFLPKREQEEISGTPAQLLSIVVDQNDRGEGIAQVLFERLISEFKNKSVASFKIVVGLELAHAEKFYARAGAIKAREVEVHQGERSYEYIYKMR